MIVFSLIIQLVLVSSSLSRNDRNGFSTEEEDPNLVQGFDLKQFRIDQLKLHNYYRSKHAGVPPLTLSKTLTTYAQSFAEFLAKLNTGSQHCRKRKCNPSGAGENLAHSRGGENVEVNATEAWYNEVWFYNFCDKSGNGGKRVGHQNEKIGHFTQVVWKGSTELGIGYARSKDKQESYIVARYLPPGNVKGQYEANVILPQYFLETFQDNCKGINGVLTPWSRPSECTRTCGGGVRLQTKTCTDPKPSLNGRDCKGVIKQLADKKWCNTQACPAGKKSYRQEQCQDLGYEPTSVVGSGIYACALFCERRIVGVVRDGTTCDSGKGACLGEKCIKMESSFDKNGGSSVVVKVPTPKSGNGNSVVVKVPTPKAGNGNSVIVKVPTRQVMCASRGYTRNAYKAGGKYECTLICKQKGGGWIVVGGVDPGTPCDSGRKICRGRVCTPK